MRASSGLLVLSMTFRQALIEAKLVKEDFPAVFFWEVMGNISVLLSAEFSCYLPATAEVDSRWTTCNLGILFLCAEMTWDDNQEPSIILTISAIEGHVPVGSVECGNWLSGAESSAWTSYASWWVRASRIPNLFPGNLDLQRMPGMLTSLQQFWNCGPW